MLAELVDIVQGHLEDTDNRLEEENPIDSFTLQPAKRVLAETAGKAVLSSETATGAAGAAPV